MSIWDLLTAELAPKQRPENSVTPDEYAAQSGYSVAHAGRLLRTNPKLKACRYRTDGGKAAVCYVPA